jgi:adenosylcobinamide-phosphate synthase
LSITIALALDFTFGDPPEDWHPVRILGRQIGFVEKYCRTLPVHPRIQGSVFLALNMFMFMIPVAALMFAFSYLGLFGVFANGALIYFALGGTCLAREVGHIETALLRGSVAEGREKLRMLVSRDVDSMGVTAIVSSAMETLSENFSDSAASTLFYAALGGSALAWVHRISNTLDAMAGYKTEAYIDFGYASAKLDDILNFIPSRLAALIVAMASKSAGGGAAETLRCALDYGNSLESPNAGYPIAAFAGALGVKLCGPASYFGKIKDKPYIGGGPRPDASDLGRAMALYWNSYGLASFLSLLLAWICL